MKRYILSLCLILAVNLTTNCQTAPGFNLRFTTQYPNTQIYKVLVKNDTIVTLGIGYIDSTSLDRGIVLTKLDTFSNIIKSNFLFDTIMAVPPLELVWGSIYPTPDNGFIMSLKSNLLAFPLVLKTDNDFNLEFIKAYQNLGGNNYSQMDIKPLKDGYLLHGSFRQSNGKADGYLGKINYQGEPLWFKNYGILSSTETIVDVNIMNDTTYIVGMVNSSNQSLAFSSLKIINGDGEEISTWNSGPNPEIGILRNVISADEQGFLVYGLWTVEPEPPNVTPIKSSLSKLDNNFNLLWSKKYGKEVGIGSEIMFYNFDRTIDGNFIGVGSTNIDQPTTSPMSCGWLMKFSPEGDSIWSRLDISDIEPVVFTNSHRLGGVGVLSSGSIVAGGYARKQNDYYAWLVKVTNDGCLDTLYCGLVNGVKEEEGGNARQEVAVYPNPANDMLTVETNHPGNASFEVLIFDATGKIQAAGIGIGKAVLSVQSLPSGIYFMALKFPDGKVLYEKISVLH